MTSAAAVRRALPLDLYIMAAARVTSVLGNGIVLTALTLYLHDTGAGGWAVAALLVVGSAPMVLSAPAVGMMIDRFDSRTLIVASGSWQAVACLLLAFTGSVGAILLLVLVGAIGAAFTVPVFTALTPHVVSDRHLATATAVQQGGQHIGLLAGPSIGGLLTGLTGGVQVPLLIAALTFVVSTGTGLLISARRQPEPIDGGIRMREGVTVLFRDRPIAAAAALAALATLTFYTAHVASVFLVRDDFRSSALTYGLLTAAYPLGVLSGIASASRLHTVRRILISSPLATALIAVCVAGVGLSQSLAGVFVLYALAGVGGGIASTAAMMLVLLRTPGPAVGRVLAAHCGLIRASALIAYGIGGVLLGQLGPQGAYLATGIAAVVMLLATTPVLLKAWPLR